MLNISHDFLKQLTNFRALIVKIERFDQKCIYCNTIYCNTLEDIMNFEIEGLIKNRKM